MENDQFWVSGKNTEILKKIMGEKVMKKQLRSQKSYQMISDASFGFGRCGPLFDGRSRKRGCHMLPPSTNSSTNKLIAIRKKIQKILLYKISGEKCFYLFWGARSGISLAHLYYFSQKDITGIFCLFFQRQDGWYLEHYPTKFGTLAQFELSWNAWNQVFQEMTWSSPMFLILFWGIARPGGPLLVFLSNWPARIAGISGNFEILNMWMMTHMFFLFLELWIGTYWNHQPDKTEIFENTSVHPDDDRTSNLFLVSHRPPPKPPGANPAQIRRRSGRCPHQFRMRKNKGLPMGPQTWQFGEQNSYLPLRKV